MLIGAVGAPAGGALAPALFSSRVIPGASDAASVFALRNVPAYENAGCAAVGPSAGAPASGAAGPTAGAPASGVPLVRAILSSAFRLAPGAPDAASIWAQCDVPAYEAWLSKSMDGEARLFDSATLEAMSRTPPIAPAACFLPIAWGAIRIAAPAPAELCLGLILGIAFWTLFEYRMCRARCRWRRAAQPLPLAAAKRRSCPSP